MNDCDNSGPLRKFLHWGPILSLVIVASLTISVLSTQLSNAWTLIFQLTMCLTLYNMWSAMLIGPGFVGKDDQDKETNVDDRDKVVDKKEINRYCHRCKHIVLKKHHHCKWINTCVGGHNEKHFLRFLYCTLMVSLQATIYLLIDSLHEQASLIFNLLNIGLSVGVFIAVSALLYIH